MPLKIKKFLYYFFNIYYISDQWPAISDQLNNRHAENRKCETYTHGDITMLKYVCLLCKWPVISDQWGVRQQGSLSARGALKRQWRSGLRTTEPAGENGPQSGPEGS